MKDADKKAKRAPVGISFPPGLHEKAKAKAGNNLSAYVCELIERDLAGPRPDDLPARAVSSDSPTLIGDLAEMVCNPIVSNELNKHLETKTPGFTQAMVLRALLDNLNRFFREGGHIPKEDPHDSMPMVVNPTHLPVRFLIPKAIEHEDRKLLAHERKITEEQDPKRREHLEQELETHAQPLWPLLNAAAGLARIFRGAVIASAFFPTQLYSKRGNEILEQIREYTAKPAPAGGTATGKTVLEDLARTLCGELVAERVKKHLQLQSQAETLKALIEALDRFYADGGLIIEDCFFDGSPWIVNSTRLPLHDIIPDGVKFAHKMVSDAERYIEFLDASGEDNDIATAQTKKKAQESLVFWERRLHRLMEVERILREAAAKEGHSIEMTGDPFDYDFIPSETGSERAHIREKLKFQFTPPSPEDLAKPVKLEQTVPIEAPAPHPGSGTAALADANRPTQEPDSHRVDVSPPKRRIIADTNPSASLHATQAEAVSAAKAANDAPSDAEVLLSTQKKLRDNPMRSNKPEESNR